MCAQYLAAIFAVPNETLTARLPANTIKSRNFVLAPVKKCRDLRCQFMGGLGYSRNLRWRFFISREFGVKPAECAGLASAFLILIAFIWVPESRAVEAVSPTPSTDRRRIF